MTVVTLDTSAAIPWVHRSHPAHAAVHAVVGDRTPVLTTHSLAETYSVLTRAPAALRLRPDDAAAVLEREFGTPVRTNPELLDHLPRHLADRGVSGGATYDALVALAAASSGTPLITRDARAASTYRTLDTRYEVVPD